MTVGIPLPPPISSQRTGTAVGLGLRDPKRCGEPSARAGKLVEFPRRDLQETIDMAMVHDSADLASSELGPDLVESLNGSDLGQYHFKRLLGAGTMGRVYLAEHRDLGRSCAVKVIHPDLIQRQPAVRSRFRAEAQAIASLAHPSIVMVHNLSSDRGYDLIEMEYVPGSKTLRDVVVQRGALPPIEAIRMTRQVVQALGHAHRKGLVHRDVKPTNVLMTPDNRAKLADFGLACKVETGSDPSGIVGETSVAGTPSFMAPELFTGGPASPRSDFYAVGVTLYYLLLARLPFLAESVTRQMKAHRDAPVPLDSPEAQALPAGVLAVLKCALAKDPANRFATAEEFDEALARAIPPERDLERIIHEALDGLDGFVLGGGNHYRVQIPLSGNRLQEVYLGVQPGLISPRQLAIFSVCGSAAVDHHEFVLRLNAELIGGVSIRDFGGQSMYFMTRTFDERTVHPREIRAAVEEIARRADWLESRLSHYDVY